MQKGFVDKIELCRIFYVGQIFFFLKILVLVVKDIIGQTYLILVILLLVIKDNLTQIELLRIFFQNFYQQ